MPVAVLSCTSRPPPPLVGCSAALTHRTANDCTLYVSGSGAAPGAELLTGTLRRGATVSMRAYSDCERRPCLLHPQ